MERLEEVQDLPQLELKKAIGFNGGVRNGLQIHPDRQHLIYPLGSTIIIENIDTGKQHFLRGHTDTVTCVAVSKARPGDKNGGAYIASGQVTHMGFLAPIIVWEFETKQLYHKFDLHKVKVEALAFSPSNKYLVSLGGQDDGSIVVWDVEKKKAICGQPAQLDSAGDSCCVAFHKDKDTQFVTGGDRTLRVWDLDAENRKIHPTDVTMGQYNRNSRSIIMTDPYLLCGTTTGDILGINIETKLFQFHGPGSNKGPHSKVKNFSCGVTAIAFVSDTKTLADSGKLIVGSGDGEVALVCLTKKNNNQWVFEKKKSWRDENLKGKIEVTSIALRGEGHQFFVGMSNCHIYKFNFDEFTAELVKTCHNSCVTSVVFPFGMSDLFLTSQKGEIRVWHLKTCKELFRTEVPNMTCTALAITRDGRLIISAWDDGKIRLFALTKDGLKLKFTRGEAHSKGVSAIDITSDGHTIVSGGGEGQVRIWDISYNVDNVTLRETMKEHKGAVTDIKISRDDRSCVSSSKDGTSIVWNIADKKRDMIVFANSLFKSVVYSPDELQIVTGGTDRKIAYWGTKDGALIRELEAGAAAINALDQCTVDQDNAYLVTGSDDKLLKLWRYYEGDVHSVGIGHSGPIQKVKVCPGMQYIVSVSADGAILVWSFPRELCAPR